MGDIWVNPSQNAVIYDRNNNRHLQPRERTTIPPDPMLVQTGKLLHVAAKDVAPAAAKASAPVRLVSRLVVEDAPEEPRRPSLVLDEDEDESIPRRRKKSG